MQIKHMDIFKSSEISVKKKRKKINYSRALSLPVSILKSCCSGISSCLYPLSLLVLVPGPLSTRPERQQRRRRAPARAGGLELRRLPRPRAVYRPRRPCSPRRRRTPALPPRCGADGGAGHLRRGAGASGGAGHLRRASASTPQGSVAAVVDSQQLQQRERRAIVFARATGRGRRLARGRPRPSPPGLSSIIPINR